MESITKNYNEGSIVVVVPSETDANFEMYNVIRRLKRVAGGTIIPNFFKCEICEKIIKANTVESHATMTRHFKKCTGPGEYFRTSFDLCLLDKYCFVE